MNFRIGRHVHVDDGGQVGHVQPASRHIGGDQHGATAVHEANQHLVTIALLQIAVQLQHAETLRMQQLGHRAAAGLGIAEGEGALRAEMLQQSSQGRQSLVFGHLIPTLLDLIAAVLRSHLDGDGIAHEARGQLGNTVGVSR